MGQCFSSTKRAAKEETPSQVYQVAQATAQHTPAQQAQQLHHQQWLQQYHMQQQQSQALQAGQPPQAQYGIYQPQQDVVAPASTHSGNSAGSSPDTASTVSALQAAPQPQAEPPKPANWDQMTRRERIRWRDANEQDNFDWGAYHARKAIAEQAGREAEQAGREAAQARSNVAVYNAMSEQLHDPSSAAARSQNVHELLTALKPLIQQLPTERATSLTQNILRGDYENIMALIQSREGVVERQLELTVNAFNKLHGSQPQQYGGRS